MTEENSQNSGLPEMRPPKQEIGPRARRAEARSTNFWAGLVLSSATVLVGGALILAVLFTVEYRRFNTLVLGILLFALGAIGLTVCLRRLARKEPEGRRKSKVSPEMRELPLSDERIADAVVRSAQSAPSTQEGRSTVGQGRKESTQGQRLAPVRWMALGVSLVSAAFAASCWFFGEITADVEYIGSFAFLATPFAVGGIAFAAIGMTVAFFVTGWRVVRDRTGRPRFRRTDILVVTAYAIVLSWLAFVLTGPPNNAIELGLQRLFGRHDLSAAQLSGAYLSGADLSGANLREANLTEADLAYANLSGADLNGADLSGANLHGADLSGANLSGVNLSGTYLSYANLAGAIVSDAQLTRAKSLTGTTLPDSSLHE